MAQVTLNRQKLGIEDLEWGTGTVTQTRGGQQVTITRVNAADIPYDDLQTLSQAIEPIVTQILPVLDEVLQADTNAATASASASAASASELNAASLLDQFDDRYLGSKAIAPTLDNDGEVLLIGALYFDTVMNKLRIWDGGAWSDALTLTAGSISTLTNKTIDDISNKVGANHIHHECRNTSGATIPASTVVTAQGIQSGTDYVEIVPVTDPQTQIAIGITHTSISNNGIGLVLNTGVSDDYTNTSIWPVGTILYPNTSGGLTNVKPTSGQYQACAIVLRQHATQGRLLVEFTEPKYLASTTQAGYVQLNNTLTSTSDVQALTAAQGKVLHDTTEKLANKGVANGYASLDASGLVPSSQLPSYVDDVLEFANLVGFPVTGEVGKIYIALDTNRSYRWSGTVYVDITGMVDSVNGKVGAVALMAGDIGSTAVGTVSATNVQAAIQELDTEKAPLDSPAFIGIPSINGVSFSGYSGFKNYLINGNFDIWQRADSQTTSGYGSDDRWTNLNGGSTKTHSQVAVTDTERALFNASFFSRTVVTSVAGAGNYCSKTQLIENINKLAGKTVTLSFWAKADANKNISIEMSQYFGTGGNPSAIVTGIGSQLVALTPTWQKKSITITLPSIIGKTIGSDGAHTSYTGLQFWFDAGSDYNTKAASLGQQSGTFDIAQVQIEEGSVATPFEQRPYGLELSLCQRYYETSNGIYIQKANGTGTTSGNQAINDSITFKVSKRVIPTTAVFNHITLAVNEIRDVASGAAVGATSLGIVSAIRVTNTTAPIDNRSHGFIWTASAEL